MNNTVFWGKLGSIGQNAGGRKPPGDRATRCLTVAVCLIVLSAACAGGGNPGEPVDGGTGGSRDAGPKMDMRGPDRPQGIGGGLGGTTGGGTGGTTGRGTGGITGGGTGGTTGGGTGGGTCLVTSGSKLSAGQHCGCAGDCSSGFCADGYCCNEACSAGCSTCNQSGSEGVCVGRAKGDAPRTASDCKVSSSNPCGLDGTCDGSGSCQTAVNGTACGSGTCQGATIVGASLCDGKGDCLSGSTVLCTPFSCDVSKGACYDKCASNSQCDAHACDATGSCGKRLPGSACMTDSQCFSGFCADGVCCNSACQGQCVSCKLTGRLGTCTPVDLGAPDPHGVCSDLGSSRCRQNGLCDGVGGCSLYQRAQVCLSPSCSGNVLNMAATCDGIGACRMPGLQECTPFVCDAKAGACTTVCSADSECAPGISCVNHSCGPKQNGQPCAQASECKSGQCVDKICCESACTGGCRSCALVGSLGKCTMVSAGNADPRATCSDGGAAVCGSNGKCDGAGSCQLYAKGTTCTGESCASNVYTGPSSCDGAGRCVTPDALPCSPYVCNGSKCFSACSTDAQCLTPNRCASNSCGQSNNGATCTAANQCKSGFCAQGVCCDKSCTGACQSCALSGTVGTCTNVATGTTDPTGMCKDQGTATCGTNGKCQAGACQKYASGTTCTAASCPSGSVTFTGASTCDGAGTCVRPAAATCSPYVCGTNACKIACTSNSDCNLPAVCTNNSCGLKDNARSCASATECKSGFCSQGVCCSTNCNGTCKSCSLSATAGTCTNVAVGTSDPQGTCKDQGVGSCGTTGVCDGAGACQRYAAGAICVASSCASGSSTQTNARTCDGAGTCKTATTTNCTPYMCSGTTSCNTACKVDGDCVGAICDPKTNLCGTFKRQGQACTVTTDCLTGLSCVDGVCCGSTSCPTCMACNVTGTPGTCANVPSGTAEPHTRCATSTSSPCGNTGACNGSGACQLQASGVSCANASCSVSTYTPPSTCSGAGSCVAPATMSCSPYVCGTGACKSSCTADSDCVSPNTCQGSGTTKNCALKANGLTCTAAGQCISGSCVDGVCCGSASCAACNACNISGHAGTCSGTAAGATDTRCGATTSACGKTNSCDGAGACANSTAQCAAAMCSGSTYTPASVCSGSSTTCPVVASMSCGAYACTTSGCKTSCTTATTASDCAALAYCDSNNKCQSAGGLGAGCSADNQCAAGRCVDGVCCNTSASACPRCQSCNVMGSPGTCTSVGAGKAEPHGLCPTSSNVCGNTGTCAADQTCAQVAAGTSCGSASCSAGTATSATTCDGAGSCQSPTVQACNPYVCGGTACKGSCVTDADCVAGDYCDGVACQTKKTPGTTCALTDECASGVCGFEMVCCNVFCADAGTSCTLPTSPGTCQSTSMSTSL